MQSLHPSPSGAVPASMPVYRPHVLREDASHHVLAWSSAPSSEDLAFAARLVCEVRGRHTLLNAADCGGHEGLLEALEAALENARAGTHLYLSGTEQQVWQLYNTACAHGMHPQEISVQRSAESLSPVYCVHCSTYQETGDTGLTTCVHCGVHLVIRDHFSRLLGAYMGVVADADRPFGKALR